MSRGEIVAELTARSVPRERAVLYADAFCEYREAQRNIHQHGSIVQHPRTGNPIPNPYLPIRDSAIRRLRAMRGSDTEFLWRDPPPSTEPPA